MIKTDIAVIGGGPAGICAAINVAASGAEVILVDRNSQLGGQLIKQTHMFFWFAKAARFKKGYRYTGYTGRRNEKVQ